MSINYRPWGDLVWLLSRLNSDKLNFYGCLSTEDRCLETYRLLCSNDSVSNAKFLEILDPHETAVHVHNRNEIKNDLLAINSSINIVQHKLLCPISEVYLSIKEFIKASNGKIVLDISSFPKRFFFPLVKLLVGDKSVSKLIVTYTTPKRYSSNDLSDSPMDWSHIPMFDNDDPDTIFSSALIGLGFMPLGLSSLFRDKFSELDIKLMFPFPPGSPFFQRTWKFIEDMQINPKIDFKDILRVDAINISEIFDLILSISSRKEILIAPYGPKTMSLAMCLFACLTNSPVYYSQPTTYDSKYSEGVDKCIGYCIKLNDQNLYTLK